MKLLKFLGKILLFLVMAGLFLLPVGTLYYISQAEQAQYETPTVFVGPPKGYGEAVTVARMDISETTTVQARVISQSYAYMELSYRNPYEIRWLAEVGDEVKEGALLGFYRGEEIYSEATGILREISLGEKPYLRFDTMDKLLLECYVSDIQKSIFLRNNLSLTDEQGYALEVLDVGLFCSQEGTRVLLAYDKPNLAYGMVFDKLVLSTGRFFSQALVVEERCVYQKAGEENYYVRLLDEAGYFISEAPVEVGYSNGTFICISGVPEGSLCDSGYKDLIHGTP